MSSQRSSLLHLRFPFSFFLLPIYLAGLWVGGPVDVYRSILVFVVLHLLVYPASNGFNSYFDRDEGPIGGLEVPPPVTRALLIVALGLDLLGLGLAFLAGPLFALAVFVYGGFSKLYSWPPVRLKRLPLSGWLATGLGQGGLTMIAVVIGTAERGLKAVDSEVCAAAVLVTLLLLGIYPLTQVYQHEEDARRGDRTISLVLGVRKTFALSGVFLVLAMAGLAVLIDLKEGRTWAFSFLALQMPALILFVSWARAVLRDAAAADFGRAMRMNLVASAFLNLSFALLVFRS